MYEEKDMNIRGDNAQGSRTGEQICDRTRDSK